MVNTAYFDPAVGGSGLTVTDDGNPTTGLDNDGHRERFVPALAQVVAVAQHVVDTAEDVNMDKFAAQQAVVDAQAQVDLAADQVALAAQQVGLAANQVTLAAQQVSLAGSQAGIATTKAGEAALSALAASNSATAASNSADEAEYWAGQAGASVTGGVKVSGTDTTAKPLSDKIKFVGGTSTILNRGGDEVLLISVSGDLVGTQGGQGFGVGVYPSTLPSGFSNMTGNTDPANENYGNYQYSDGSVMVFVPKFFYRIGHTSSPRYATYGLNAVDIVGVETFANEAAANAAGYALHRAFIDGGVEKSGFFIDKYLASKNGTTSCKSVKNGNPISLTTNTGYNPSNGMTGCTGILADAVVLARSRGAGTFNVASVFMYSALALLSLAHAQASTSTTHCAWYNATHNFPKGCNIALKDTNDASVTFTSAGNSGDANKPLTGSGNPFAKTTHNGQSCGVADLNGAIYQVMLGITNAGTSATDTAQIANGNAYILKRSVSLSSLTGGWNGANDAWGDATNLATKYDLVSGIFPWGSATGAVYFGNGSNQVCSGAASGVSYNRTACGIQDTTNGTSASGTNQFGTDYCYQYNIANLFPLGAGTWINATNTGVFCRSWYTCRTNDLNSAGFRVSAYGF